MFRIEQNQIDFPQVNFALVLFWLASGIFLIYSGNTTAAQFILTIGIWGTIIIYCVSLISYMIEVDRMNKEWTTYILTKGEKR